jgi:hypothetical protein
MGHNGCVFIAECKEGLKIGKVKPPSHKLQKTIAAKKKAGLGVYATPPFKEYTRVKFILAAKLLPYKRQKGFYELSLREAVNILGEIICQTFNKDANKARRLAENYAETMLRDPSGIKEIAERAEKIESSAPRIKDFPLEKENQEFSG